VKTLLKIWGRTNSINVQKVMWTVGELSLAHERIDAGMQFGIVDEPWFRAMNPNGRVPTIDDDGFILWESNAIVRYLARKHNAGSLSPANAQTRASADRWMDWSTTTMAPLMTPLFWGHIRTAPEKRDLQALEAQRLQMEQVMKMLDAQLATSHYVAGNEITVGDIAVGCFVHRWYALPLQRGSHPHVAAWYARLSQRPAFRSHVMLPLS
jgi:glutathione S-transferase